MGELLIEFAIGLFVCVFSLLLLLNVLLRPRLDSTFLIAQHAIESIFGLVASVFGLLLLFSVLLLPSIRLFYNYVPQTPGRSWLPAVLAYDAVLTVIGLGVVLHGLFGIVGRNRRARLICAWAVRFLLGTGSVGLLVLVYLSGFSIGLFFLPSLYLVLFAFDLALMPRPSSNPTR